MEDISAKLVEALYAGSPAPVGCRVNHARGLLVEGRFRPSAEARRLSAAALFDGPERSLVARFSSFSGNPHIAQDSPGANPRGLALRMEADGGMDLVGHSAGGFPASDPERFLAFLEASNAKAKDPEHQRRQTIEASATSRPDVPSAPGPSSFGSLRYHMLHAYALMDAGGRRTVGRLTVEPTGESATLSFSGPDCLDEELRHRLGRRSMVMALSFVPAMPGDATDDIKASWSGGGIPVALGLLSFDHLAENQERQSALAFDPSRVPPGIGFAGDPMIEPRARAYRLAAQRRAEL